MPRFEKGNKAARGHGRPREPGKPTRIVVREIREAAPDYTGDALARLHEIMMDPECPPSACVAAAKELLDRAWGRGHAEDRG